MDRLAFITTAGPRITWIVGALLTLAAVLLLPATVAMAESPSPKDAAPTAEALGWLAGCWAREGQEPGTGETWTEPAGGTMLGTSRTVRAGKTAFHEFMMIRPVEEEGLEFVAWPSGQTETAFRMVHLGERRVVFENPEHDFPQRVIYHLREDVRLEARIEGEQDGEERGVDFPMRRVTCP